MTEHKFKDKVSQYTVNYIHALFMAKRMIDDSKTEYQPGEIEQHIKDTYKFHEHTVAEIIKTASKMSNEDAVVNHIHNATGIQNEFLIEICSAAVKIHPPAKSES